jgi:hypothetical protein
MHLHTCRSFWKHSRTLLLSLRALCLAPGGPGNILMYKYKRGYTIVRPHIYTYSNYMNIVANVDMSDSRCTCQCMIITRDLRFVASKLYRIGVTRPRSPAAMTLSLSLGADLLHCISCTREMESKEKH